MFRKSAADADTHKHERADKSSRATGVASVEAPFAGRCGGSQHRKPGARDVAALLRRPACRSSVRARQPRGIAGERKGAFQLSGAALVATRSRPVLPARPIHGTAEHAVWSASQPGSRRRSGFGQSVGPGDGRSREPSPAPSFAIVEALRAAVYFLTREPCIIAAILDSSCPIFK